MFTKTQEQILIHLFSNPEEQLTIRGLSKKLKKSYTLIYNNLLNLEKRDIIKKKNIPPGKIITLNKFLKDNIIIDLEIKKRTLLFKKHPWIQVMTQDLLSNTNNILFILLIFGSYAKNKETKKSDLDLLFILQDKKYIKDVEKPIIKSYTKVKKSLNFIDINDFKEMIGSNEFNIGNEARKHHVILHGIDQYIKIK